jgi:hypothetical protein
VSSEKGTNHSCHHVMVYSTKEFALRRHLQSSLHKLQAIRQWQQLHSSTRKKLYDPVGWTLYTSSYTSCLHTCACTMGSHTMCNMQTAFTCQTKFTFSNKWSMDHLNLLVIRVCLSSSQHKHYLAGTVKIEGWQKDRQCICMNARLRKSCHSPSAWSLYKT